MTVPGNAEPLLLASTAQVSSYTISRSLRLNNADSADLSRTFGTPTTQNVLTWSGWVKRSRFGVDQSLFGASSTNTLKLEGGDSLTLTAGGSAVLTTTAELSDPTGWYHIVWRQNGTAHEVYVNGVSIGTVTATSSVINTAVSHRIGSNGSGDRFGGYLADIYFIDGQALTPTSFGEFDATTGVWVPKAYTGTYGANGFHLEFADNSNNTAATLGKDTSGNGNNWTPNNLSVTAGAGNDSLVDVPTNGSETDTGAGGEVRGNYCTWNAVASHGSSTTTITNGCLEITSSEFTFAHLATVGVGSGKWYWEYTIDSAVADDGPRWGFSNASGSVLAAKRANDSKFETQGGVSVTTTGTNDIRSGVVGIALNLDNGTAKIYHNNSERMSVTSIPSDVYFPFFRVDNNTPNDKITANFGQRPFAYSAPSGHKVLCTTNIPEGTITTSGSFTGNASTNGPFVYLNGVPTAMTINGNAVTFGTHADKLANGFKVRSSSGSYNTAGNNTFSITSTGDKFKNARAQANP